MSVRTIAYALVGPGGSPRFELPEGKRLVLGRAAGCDVPVFDPTISRRHAELAAADGGVHVRDLGSSNGTFVNGERVTEATVAPGDTLTFGRLVFAVERPAPPPPTADPAPPPQPRMSETILARRVPSQREAYESALGRAGPDADTTGGEPVAARDQRRLALLLELSKGLGRPRAPDELLGEILATLFQIMEADRAAILLREADGTLVTHLSRDRRGRVVEEAVPRSIAGRAAEERVALLTDDAPSDTRFGGESIVAQQVRSAMCVPLVGSDGEVLGVLYVDDVTLSHRFDESDLDFLVAFAGIAAVALENSRLAARLQHEAVVRGNFERYFAPQLAARIAEHEDEVRLGGERRDVVVLFADIRGFTPLAESMEPDEMATLLSEYFSEMVECVFRHDGTLDKFMGDAVMAQWGAPVAADDDADRAVRAALDMQRAMARLNAGWRAAGRPELEIGIGIACGPAFAGNIGSERRLEYTVIGDIVNTANRLCAVARPGEILVSEDVCRRLRHPLPMEAGAPLDLRGKTQAVRVFRVLS